MYLAYAFSSLKLLGTMEQCKLLDELNNCNAALHLSDMSATYRDV